MWEGLDFRMGTFPVHAVVTHQCQSRRGKGDHIQPLVKQEFTVHMPLMGLVELIESLQIVVELPPGLLTVLAINRLTQFVEREARVNLWKRV